MKIELESVACDLCGGLQYDEIYRKRDIRYNICDQSFSVVVCRRCGLGFTNPRPTAASLSHFYPEGFYELRQHPCQLKRYETIRRSYLPQEPGRLLDIGCHLGEFIAYMTEFGWKCQGCELYPVSNPLAQSIYYGAFDQLDLPLSYYDVITAIAVIEHVSNPMDYFRKVKRLLKPGGRFVFLVTNLHSRASRDFFCEDIPRHLYFFAPETVTCYCRVVGLNVKTVDHTNQIIPSTSRGWLVYLVRSMLRLPIDADRVQIPTFKRYRSGQSSASAVVAWTPIEALDRLLGPLYNVYTAMIRNNMVVLYVVTKSP